MKSMAKHNSLQKSALRKSSREAVQKTFARLRRPMRRNKWLWEKNVYREKCIKTLWKHTQPGSSVNTNDLADYIAASTALHCADGWGFLGRALACHTYGDSDTARHLGYYAELRAAMSLLATEGIGIFDDRHFVVDLGNTCQPIGTLPKAKKRGWLGTHAITWLALEHWANRISSTDILAEIIQPAGIPLRDWLRTLSTGSSWRPIGSSWLKAWGLDLRRLTDDRDARNAASYRPTHLNPVTSLDALSSSNFMRNLWEIFEPSAGSSFEILDRHLLRLSLEVGFRAISDKKPELYPNEFAMTIRTVLNALALSESSAQHWQDFLTRKIEHSDPIIISEARQSDKVTDPRHHIQVLSRATLLLRVATGACAQLLRKTGFGNRDLEFWWKPFGVERGLWENGNEPMTLMDLWADVEMALKETREWEINNARKTPSFARWRRDKGHTIPILAECERIALWGLGL